jgi:hypothetical protein
MSSPRARADVKLGTYSNPLNRRADTDVELHTADRMAFTLWSLGVSIAARLYVIMDFGSGKNPTGSTNRSDFGSMMSDVSTWDVLYVCSVEGVFYISFGDIGFWGTSDFDIMRCSGFDIGLNININIQSQPK